MIKLAEATAALYCALQERNHCEVCNGSGVNWVRTGDDGCVDAELCECAMIAKQALERYQPQYEAAIRRYFAEREITPSEAMMGHENLVMRLFGDVA